MSYYDLWLHVIRQKYFANSWKFLSRAIMRAQFSEFLCVFTRQGRDRKQMPWIYFRKNYHLVRQANDNCVNKQKT